MNEEKNIRKELKRLKKKQKELRKKLAILHKEIALIESGKLSMSPAGGGELSLINEIPGIILESQKNIP